LPRFFLPESFPLSDVSCLPECIELSGEDAFHLSVSLRARIGDEVSVCSAGGIEITCRISNITGGKKCPVVLLQPLCAQPSEAESPVRISVFQGMPKGKKTDSILQKCTELGADEIVFVYTDRSLPTMEGKENKLERYQRIANEAAKQCGRGKLVRVRILPSLDAAVGEMKEADLFFVCYENEKKVGLRRMLSRENYQSAAFFIGPEGGISPREAELFQRAQIPTVSLGKRILRTETASLAVLSMFLYQKEL